MTDKPTDEALENLITLRKPTTSAELLWLLKLAHLVISDVGKTLEESVAPAQPAAEPWRSAVLDLIDDCPGLTLEQDRWLSRRVKELDFASTPQPTQPQAGGSVNGWPVEAAIYKRRDEWVLELSGTINDCAFTCRHTQPGYLQPEDVAGLPSLYSEGTAPQPAPAPLSERDAFERDWEKRHAPAPINGRTHDDGRYGDSSIQDAWESWQARAALAAQGGKDA